MEEPLHPLPIEKWSDVQRAFKSEWPYGISGYKALETQREWLKKGYQNAWKVYCPYGDIWNGFVAINIKVGFRIRHFFLGKRIAFTAVCLKYTEVIKF